MADMIATPANMKRLAEGPLRVRGARLVAYSPHTDERYSANHRDYWHLPDDEPLPDGTGAPMVLAYVYEGVAIVEDSNAEAPGDAYREAIATLARHPSETAGDAELLEGCRQILSVLHDRFSEEGEKRGGDEGADAIERTCDAFDVLVRVSDDG